MSCHLLSTQRGVAQIFVRPHTLKNNKIIIGRPMTYNLDDLANFAHEVADENYESFRAPTAVLIDAVACGLSGRSTASWQSAAEVLLPTEGAPLDSSAFLNAFAINAEDFDDTHFPTVLHPSTTVVGTLLALAKSQELTLERFSSFTVSAFEIMLRLALNMHPDHYARGYHITATLGGVGASVAAGLAQGLNQSQLGHAIGIAAGSAGGLVGNLAFSAKSVSVGEAARRGVLAAAFAKRGITANPAILDGPSGVLKVLGGTPEQGFLRKQREGDWEILRVTAKPYPVGVVLMPAIEMALDLHRSLPSSAIEQVVLTGHPLLGVRTDRPHVATAADARLSAQYIVAHCLVHGAPGPEDLEEARRSDPMITSLMPRIRVEAEPDMALEAGRLRVVFADGREATSEVAQAFGTPAKPMTRNDLEAKLMVAAERCACAQQADEMLARLRRAGPKEGLADLMGSLLGGGLIGGKHKTENETNEQETGS